VCFVTVTSVRIVIDGNKETTYLLTYLLIYYIVSHIITYHNNDVPELSVADAAAAVVCRTSVSDENNKTRIHLITQCNININCAGNTALITVRRRHGPHTG